MNKKLKNNFSFQRFHVLSGFFALWFLCSAQVCTKVIAYSQENRTETISKSYKADIKTTYENTKLTLQKLGYQILHEDATNHKIITGWKSTESNSHYFNLFGRPDYSAPTGSYYQVLAFVSQSGNEVEVSLATNVKSVSGKLVSSKVVENKIFKQLSDYMRRPQIEITNVGMEER